MSSELLKLPQGAPIFIYPDPMKMTYGIPGLLRKIEDEVKYKPHSKGLYVFVSKDYRRIKMIWWDRTGYALFYKFAPAGLFRTEWKGGYKEITGVKLKELLNSKTPAKAENTKK